MRLKNQIIAGNSKIKCNEISGTELLERCRHAYLDEPALVESKIFNFSLRGSSLSW
jgi:hypothetical protein